MRAFATFCLLEATCTSNSFAMSLREAKDLMRSISLASAANFTGSLSGSKEEAFFTTNWKVQINS
uniref:Putative ovule protein n=1 Tax=Solanum chacoense TaxID=4108 RepID=A0A0V0H5V1_SOLCH